jgi:hypothetical protein
MPCIKRRLNIPENWKRVRTWGHWPVKNVPDIKHIMTGIELRVSSSCLEMYEDLRLLFSIKKKDNSKQNKTERCTQEELEKNTTKNFVRIRFIVGRFSGVIWLEVGFSRRRCRFVQGEEKVEFVV